MTASLILVDDPSAYITLAVLVAALAGLAAVVNRLSGLGHARDDLVAAARATLQLGVVGLVIAAVLQSWWLTLLFVVMMASVASATAGRRLARHGRWPLASIPVCLGALPVTAVLLLSRLVPTTPIALVPIVGILVGGAMTATTLAGRRTLEGLRNRRGEVEAALSLGLPDRDARLLIIRDDAALALLPGLDQTRTVGLVTLPGAFVGMLLGGATPLQAAAVQLLVLAALLLVQAVATPPRPRSNSSLAPPSTELVNSDPILTEVGVGLLSVDSRSEANPAGAGSRLEAGGVGVPGQGRSGWGSKSPWLDHHPPGDPGRILVGCGLPDAAGCGHAAR